MFPASAVLTMAKPDPPPRTFRSLGENVPDRPAVNRLLSSSSVKPQVLTYTPSHHTVSPVSSQGGLGYRFASVDRLTQRQRVYDSSQGSPIQSAFHSYGSLSRTLPPHLNLSTKRELFFRPDGGTSATSTSTSNVTSTVSSPYSSLQTKDDILSRQKDREREKFREKEMELGSSKEMEDYVGFANLPNQVYRKAVKRGFDFTILVVETSKVILRENGVKLTLTIVDTPGFGDAVDNSQCWHPVLDYVESRYEDYLDAESRVHRTSIVDMRVHCCLYFVSPGHGLKPLDLEFMKNLHDKVNLIPLVAKADTMTAEECYQFKKTVLNEITQNKIRIYEFPDCEDGQENKSQQRIKERIPFAVVGSNVVVETNGKRVRGRKYPWGVVEVENMEHCDFVALRNILIRTHLQDLKDVTNNIHYENYRCLKLATVGKSGITANKNPLARIEEDRKDHENKMKMMERQMEQVLEMKVKEKLHKLRDSESELHRRSEQVRKNLDQQKHELYQKWKEFDKERAAPEDMDDAQQRLTLDLSPQGYVDGKDKKKEKKKGLF
ncbi:septin-7-like isoform X2 [Tachypleus tridentatus]|uniref:septin-7-like isoform X2 n=1 Tax=Tachypleus tridentatus TaxID=6853 RepID=UPI003FD0991A